MPVHEIFQALDHRPLILGCDRELMLLLFVICAALSFSSASLYICLLSVCLWAAGFFLLRLMAKKDELLRQVYVRQLHYHSLYLAQATLRTAGGKRYAR